ncbi:hypothetical protein Lal_00044889 [Lupinus albus]|nr:hypothetical protein Lal_00044889 [Lupinus albus]
MSQRQIIEVLVDLGRYTSGTTVDALSEGTRTSLIEGQATSILRELADGRTVSATHRAMSGGGWVATFEDITERRRNEDRITYMARHDALTDLPNRVALHEIGNAMLGQPRLQRQVRESATVARIGGDEFVVLHRVKALADAEVLARRLIAAVSAPYDFDGSRIEIGMSAGIVLSGREDCNVTQLLQNADLALYQAKSDGRGTYRVFEPQMDESARARLSLERELRDALSNGCFEVHYQPLVELSSNDVMGLEALVRWRHAERGLVSPAVFIPIAEETGLIVQLGEWSGCCGRRARTQLGGLARNVACSARLWRPDRDGRFWNWLFEHSYLRRFPFDKIKIDRSFVREIGEKPEAAAIIRAIIGLGQSLNMTTLVEGIETDLQRSAILAEGANEMQGFLFSPPRPASEIDVLFKANQSQTKRHEHCRSLKLFLLESPMPDIMSSYLSVRSGGASLGLDRLKLWLVGPYSPWREKEPIMTARPLELLSAELTSPNGRGICGPVACLGGRVAGGHASGPAEMIQLLVESMAPAQGPLKADATLYCDLGSKGVE